MVYRVLLIVNRIAFGLMTLAFAACLVYTLTAPVVQAGVQQAQQSAEQVAASAMDALQSQLTNQTDEALAGVLAALDPVRRALSDVVANFTASDVGGASSVAPTYSGLSS